MSSENHTTIAMPSTPSSTPSAADTIALVTGANTGIGEAIARRLAAEAGYTVLIGARSVKKGEAVASSIRQQGHAAHAIQLDLVSDDSIAAAVETIRTRYGKLDVLVNNAAVLFDDDAEFADKARTIRQLFEKTYAVNVFGTATLSEALIPLLRAAAATGTNPPPPRVVFVSSELGSLALTADADNNPYYNKDRRAYSSSKAALNSLALGFAIRLEDIGARVNIVTPGLTSTRMNGFMPNAAMPDGRVIFESAPTDVGAQRIVELAQVGADGPTMTFSSRDGPFAW